MKTENPFLPLPADTALIRLIRLIKSAMLFVEQFTSENKVQTKHLPYYMIGNGHTKLYQEILAIYFMACQKMKPLGFSLGVCSCPV